MNVKEEWEITLKNPIFNGLNPIIDPFENDKLLISDGWGSSYSSMKLRKISLLSGKEIGSTYIKNSTRCIHFDSDKNYIIAVSDNKIFKIDRIKMTLVEKYEERISKYGDYINSNNYGTYYIMNYRAGNLFIYDIHNKVGKRKKIGSCNGIIKYDNIFYILKPFEGSIAIFDTVKEKVINELHYSTFLQGHISTSGNLYLRLGKQHLEEKTNSFIDPIDKIRIYKTIFDSEFDEISIPSDCRRFCVQKTGENICLVNLNSICYYSLKSRMQYDELKFNDPYQIIRFFEEQNLVLLGNYKDNYKTIKLVKINA